MTEGPLQRFIAGTLRKAARHFRSKPLVMRNTGPLASFTFDDVPKSAFTAGAAVLEDCGIQGTFYIAGGTCGRADTYWHVIDRAQVGTLHDRGHEIGCHTFSHVPVEMLDADGMVWQCRQNLDFLRDLRGNVEVTNFCYPFGRVSLPRKLQLQKCFDSCRGIYEGINAGTVDLGMLKVIELYDRTLTEQKLDRVLRETRRRNGWLVFYTHDVAEPPSWIGSSPRLLRAAIEAAQAHGIRCLTVRDALSAIGYKGSAHRDQRLGEAREALALDPRVGK